MNYIYIYIYIYIYNINTHTYTHTHTYIYTYIYIYIYIYILDTIYPAMSGIRLNMLCDFNTCILYTMPRIF